MTLRVLVIGGYGNFGQTICSLLAGEPDLHVIIAGRSVQKAAALAARLPALIPPEAIGCDVFGDFAATLAVVRPDVVIHTSGPFQNQDYRVARACIAQRCHYLDLADGRSFVNGIATLDAEAKAAGVLVVSGASSMPCLSAALVDHYQGRFAVLRELDYGISTAQQTRRGLATAQAILNYTGRPFSTLVDGRMVTVHGWQGLHAQRYTGLGRRWLGYCDIPDLGLFPQRYPSLRSIRFYAGLEVPLLHWAQWGLSWLVRAGMLRTPQTLAPLLLRAAGLFDRWGTGTSAFHLALAGEDAHGQPLHIRFELIARSGEGAYIPCIPVVLMTKYIAQGLIIQRGATACIGFIDRNAYLDALKGLKISWQEHCDMPTGAV